MLTVKKYYENPDVRERMLEYCGSTGGNPEEITAQYMVGFGPSFAHREGFYESAPPDWGFDWFLEEGLDVFRSTWDKDDLVAVFDVEYVNQDNPALVYQEPGYAYGRLEPFLETTLQILEEYGLEPLVLMTGQGYHFSFRISKESSVYDKLAESGSITWTLASKYEVQEPELPLKEGEAYDGLGRLFEWLAGELMDRAGEVCDLPLTIGDGVPGPAYRGREQINLDLSMFADPLYMRDVRVPFSSHQKHRVYVHKVGDYIRRTVPPQYTLPRQKKDLSDLLVLRRQPEAVREYAESVESTTIPRAETAVDKMFSAYRDSRVYQAHKKFDEGYQDPYYQWSESYDRVDPGEFPPCLAESLRHPDPRLLEPTHIQSLTRWLCDRDWHPRDVAGLIRSKFERDYGWSEDWYHYDAASRADVWVRFFFTLIDSGRDEYTDMNCISFQERGICLQPFCGWNVGTRPRGE